MNALPGWNTISDSKSEVSLKRLAFQLNTNTNVFKMFDMYLKSLDKNVKTIQTQWTPFKIKMAKGRMLKEIQNSIRCYSQIKQTFNIVQIKVEKVKNKLIEAIDTLLFPKEGVVFPLYKELENMLLTLSSINIGQIRVNKIDSPNVSFESSMVSSKISSLGNNIDEQFIQKTRDLSRIYNTESQVGANSNSEENYHENKHSIDEEMPIEYNRIGDYNTNKIGSSQGESFIVNEESKSNYNEEEQNIDDEELSDASLEVDKNNIYDVSPKYNNSYDEDLDLTIDPVDVDNQNNNLPGDISQSKVTFNSDDYSDRNSSVKKRANTTVVNLYSYNNYKSIIPEEDLNTEEFHDMCDHHNVGGLGNGTLSSLHKTLNMSMRSKNSLKVKKDVFKDALKAKFRKTFFRELDLSKKPSMYRKKRINQPEYSPKRNCNFESKFLYKTCTIDKLSKEKQENLHNYKEKLKRKFQRNFKKSKNISLASLVIRSRKSKVVSPTPFLKSSSIDMKELTLKDPVQDYFDADSLHNPQLFSNLIKLGFGKL